MFMRFQLKLKAIHENGLLPFNYQYPLSSAIYKIIERADKEFAAFLHNTGYGEGYKSFKLFTFSDIKTPFLWKGDRMQLVSGEAELTICFYLPQAAENFIKGLFMNQHLEIADRMSKVAFHITQVESLAENINGNTNIILQTLSPLVTGRKNEKGHYDYRSPADADFTECLYYNWMEKCAAVGFPVAVGEEEPEVSIDVLFFNHPPQQRLITIKSGTDAETKIRGYTKFRLAVIAPMEMLELALGAGLGLHNAQGMGCVGVV
jgi:CRISPR-associated endoribonuclease Cas6